MKRSSTLFLILATSGLSQAQPVLTQAANAPTAGTSYTMHYGAYVAPGAAGANQHWDLSALVSDSTNLIQLVQPSSTPNGTSFPGATVSETGATATMYFRTAPDGMYFVGSDADLVIVNSDQAKYLPFPCTYQTAWSDDFASTFEAEDFQVFRSGTLTGMVDGYGSVILPSGTENNVLRIRWHEETIDSTEFFVMHTTYDSYLFYAVGRSYPLAQLVTATASFLGQTTTITYAQWVGGLSTNTPEMPEVSTPEVDLYPVPTSGLLNFTLPASFSGTPLITITNTAGRTVRQLPGAKWNGRGGQVDVGTLAAGIYTLTAIDENGHRAARTFVVQ